MAVVVATVTEDARIYWPQFFGGITVGTPGTPTTPPGSVWDPRIKFFKVGEGGWIDPGTGKERRDPDATLRKLTTSGSPALFLQDIDAAVDPTRAPANQRYGVQERATFKKDLSVTDISYSAAYTVEIECLLDLGDFNDDGYGNSPEIWEIGIFTDHPMTGSLASDEGLMIAYGTFPVETKDSSKQILNKVRITF